MLDVCTHYSYQSPHINKSTNSNTECMLLHCRFMKCQHLASGWLFPGGVVTAHSLQTCEGRDDEDGTTVSARRPFPRARSVSHHVQSLPRANGVVGYLYALGQDGAACPNNVHPVLVSGEFFQTMKRSGPSVWFVTCFVVPRARVEVSPIILTRRARARERVSYATA